MRWLLVYNPDNRGEPKTEKKKKRKMDPILNANVMNMRQRPIFVDQTGRSFATGEPRRWTGADTYAHCYVCYYCCLLLLLLLPAPESIKLQRIEPTVHGELPVTEGSGTGSVTGFREDCGRTEEGRRDENGWTKDGQGGGLAGSWWARIRKQRWERQREDIGCARWEAFLC